MELNGHRELIYADVKPLISISQGTVINIARIIRVWLTFGLFKDNPAGGTNATGAALERPLLILASIDYSSNDTSV